MLKPWIMTYENAYALCCLLGGHRKTVEVAKNQFGLPFIGCFSLYTTPIGIRHVLPHAIIITVNDDPISSRYFSVFYFHPRDTQIECYTYNLALKRILCASYKIKVYTPVYIFYEGKFNMTQYSIMEGSSNPYTTVCVFTPQQLLIDFTDKGCTFMTPPHGN